MVFIRVKWLLIVFSQIYRMKKIFTYILLFFIFLGCSSEKPLSIKKLKYEWQINYIASQDYGTETPYNLHSNLINSSLQNQTKVKTSLHSVNNNKDFSASNDKVEPSFLKNNYSYKSPQIIQNERINKSFNEEPQIFENEKSSANKSKIRDKKNKILWTIVSVISIGLGIFMSLFTALLFAFGETIGGVVCLLISILLAFISYFSLRIVIESNSKVKKNKIKDRFKVVLLLTITSLVSMLTVLSIHNRSFSYNNLWDNIFHPLGLMAILGSIFLIYFSYMSVKKIRESNSKDDNKDTDV